MKYTPVNKDTFGAWCVGYYERIIVLKESLKTDMDLKATGKQIFMERFGEGGYAEITEEDIAEDTREAEFTEEEEKDEQDEGAVLYDKDQFVQEMLEEGDEPDFD